MTVVVPHNKKMSLRIPPTLIAFFGTILLASLLASVGSLANLEYEYTLTVRLSLWVWMPLLLSLSELHTRGNNRLFRLSDVLQINVLVLLGFACFSASAFYFRFCPCSPHHYSYWFFVHVVSGVFLCSGAFLMLRSFERSRGNKSGAWWLLYCAGALFSLLLLDLGLFWFFPQVRFVSLLAGFIHGPIYDELILQDRSILAGGFLQIAAGLLMQIASLGLSGYLRALTAGVAALLLALPSLHGLATRVGLQHIETELSLTKSKDNWTAHYSRESNSENLENLFAEIEFHMNDLSSVLKMKLPKTHIFIYPNAELKKILIGGLDTDVTDVYTPSIHIREEAGVHSTLRHELVHAALSEIGFFGLGFHPNMALTEGLAVALAPDPFDDKVDEIASLAMENQSDEYLHSLFGLGFYKESGSKAYSVAGSWIRHLIEQGEVEKLLQVYAGKLGHDSYFSGLRPSVYDTWITKLNLVRDHAKDLETKRRSALPSLWESKCPHTLAEYWNEDKRLAEAASSQKSAGQLDEALELYKERQTSSRDIVAKLGPDAELQEHDDWLRLVIRYKEKIELETLPAKLSCHTLLPDLTKQLSALKSGPLEFKTSTEAERFLNLADCYALEGSYSQSSQVLVKLYGESPSERVLGEKIYRAITVRQEVLGILIDVQAVTTEKTLAKRALRHLARIENFSSKKKPTSIDSSLKARWIWLYLAILSGDPRTQEERREALQITQNEVIKKNLARVVAKYTAN